MIAMFKRNIVAGVKLNTAINDGADGPVPIPFYFIHPIFTIKRLIDESCEHWLHTNRGLCFSGLRAIFEEACYVVDFFFTFLGSLLVNNWALGVFFTRDFFSFTLPPLCSAICRRFRFVLTDRSFLVMSLFEASSSFFLISSQVFSPLPLILTRA